MTEKTTIEPVTIEAEGISVAGLIWRRFHRPMPGLVEATLALNSGLAALGEYLPVGTVVQIPIPPKQQQEPELKPARLWD